MSDYSRVLSLRMSAALLAGLKERARAEGRSVSGQIVYLVREQVEPRAPATPPKKITGWLSHRSVPDTQAQFREARAEASELLTGAVRRKAKVNAKAGAKVNAKAKAKVNAKAKVDAKVKAKVNAKANANANANANARADATAEEREDS